MHLYVCDVDAVLLSHVHTSRIRASTCRSANCCSSAGGDPQPLGGRELLKTAVYRVPLELKSSDPAARGCILQRPGIDYRYIVPAPDDTAPIPRTQVRSRHRDRLAPVP